MKREASGAEDDCLSSRPAHSCHHHGSLAHKKLNARETVYSKALRLGARSLPMRNGLKEGCSCMLNNDISCMEDTSLSLEIFVTAVLGFAKR
jgi:hypothetical protein